MVEGGRNQIILVKTRFAVKEMLWSGRICCVKLFPEERACQNSLFYLMFLHVSHDVHGFAVIWLSCHIFSNQANRFSPLFLLQGTLTLICIANLSSLSHTSLFLPSHRSSPMVSIAAASSDQKKTIAFLSDWCADNVNFVLPRVCVGKPCGMSHR